ncbi:DinB family protein [Echinicola sp. 20G]|uniref:DinB family protein n=1 Tax=Echinicola sp. 20G TaxID=2781961 RepID=UPI001910944D|nr:DinB family protein [Echinicola sp. 20G]
MTKIFKTLVLVFILSTSSFYALQAQTTQEEFLAKWNTMKGYTVEILEAIPEDKLGFKPVEEVNSFDEMVMHLAGGNVMMAKNFLGGADPTMDMESVSMTKADLKKALEYSFDYVAETCKGLSDDELAEQIEVFGGAMITRRQAENLIDSHGIHHRGNLVVYLRLNGIKPPQFRAW